MHLKTLDSLEEKKKSLNHKQDLQNPVFQCVFVGGEGAQNK